MLSVFLILKFMMLDVSYHDLSEKELVYVVSWGVRDESRIGFKCLYSRSFLCLHSARVFVKRLKKELEHHLGKEEGFFGPTIKKGFLMLSPGLKEFMELIGSPPYIF